jgi:C4-dicarboxylate-specific signal transduction histidine kinase
VVAVLGAASSRKIRRAEIALAEERARALEALEKSERRQAEVEKLAAAGSRAAGVAHDMSNPLASMRCNLDWLRDAVDEGRLAADKDEIAQVIRETRECLDRLGQNLQEFRSVARTARALALKVDELAAAGSPVRPVPTPVPGAPDDGAKPPARASGE